MKKLSLFLCLAVLSVSCGVALADPASTGDRAERIRLSKDLHDIRHIRDRINDTIAEAAQSIPPADREDFQKYVQLHVDYDALEKKSIDVAADVYTVPELKAMIAYFGSDAGKAAEAKSADYAGKIGPDILKQIDAAITSAKYDGVPDSSLPKIRGQSLAPTPSKDLLSSPKK